MKIIDRINKKLNALDIQNESIDNYIKITLSNSFINEADLKNYLTEGALLNVGVIAGKALSIPHGEYMVWMTDAGHTMLVPTVAKKDQEVYEGLTQQYDIFTNTLLQNWNNISKTIAESSIFENEEHENLDDEGEQISSHVDASTVDRKPILRAMQDKGLTVTALAKEVGVQPPAISRILRTPKDVQGDPQGRNPSIGLASQICGVLRLEPTAAFPDIFGTGSRYEPKAVKSNTGSGNTRNKNRTTWTQGASSESINKKLSIIEDFSTQASGSNLQQPIDSNYRSELDNQKEMQKKLADQVEDQRKKVIEPQMRKLNTDMEKITNGIGDYADEHQQNMQNDQHEIDDLSGDITSLKTLLQSFGTNLQ